MSTSATKRAALRALVGHILDGPGRAASALRRAAFENDGLDGPLAILVNKVALHPARVTDEDVRAAAASGLTEDQLFELVICAAVGESSRQYDSALRALDDAVKEGGGSHAP